jgi:hypothetical protein
LLPLLLLVSAAMLRRVQERRQRRVTRAAVVSEHGTRVCCVSLPSATRLPHAAAAV